MSNAFKRKYLPLIITYIVIMLWSVINARRYDHWIGEASVPLIGAILLVLTFKKFQFSVFTYWWILFGCFTMFVGAHYTFSRVPVFSWLSVYFDPPRNNYDKFGHFIQGIIPVLMSRELFIRKKYVQGPKLISFIAFCICLATAATYEIIEYLACINGSHNPATFLGTQGFIWDSQSDMFFCALGGLFTLAFLRKPHNKSMKREFQEDNL